MTLRDKIMDKYWLEFLATEPDITENHYRYGVGVVLENGAFWAWFYEQKVSKNHGKLEDYLK